METWRFALCTWGHVWHTVLLGAIAIRFKLQAETCLHMDSSWGVLSIYITKAVEQMYILRCQASAVSPYLH